MSKNGSLRHERNRRSRRFVSNTVGIRSHPKASEIVTYHGPNNRELAIDAAVQEVERDHTWRRIALGLKHSGGPKEKENSAVLQELPTGYPIIVCTHVRKNGKAHTRSLESNEKRW